MPFKSKAQRGLFYSMADRGEISKATVKHWEDATPKNKKLPMHVEHPKSQEKHSAFYGHGVAQAMLDIGMVEKYAKVLTVKSREHMAKNTFAQPNKTEEGHKGKYPIPDKQHAKSALGFAAMHHDTAAMKAVRAKVKAKFPEMLKKSALAKVAWPWSSGQGVSTIAQNYHPDTVTRARDVEQGQTPSVPRPNLPPQIIKNAPAPTAPSTPVPRGDPLKGAVGQQRNLLALNAQNWR